MIYRNLGRAGVKVSTICMGSAQLVEPTSWDDSVRLVHAGLDAGVNFFDSANVYGDSFTRHRSEQVLGKALRGHRDEVVIATKFRGRVGDGPNDSGTSRYHVIGQVEASLRRLETDRIDLYQTHGYDPETPMEETLRALDDLVRQGKIVYTGMSNSKGWQLAEAMWACDRLGLDAIVSEQAEYSLVARELEREVLPFTRRHGIGVLAYSPIGGGLLTGKYLRGSPPPQGSRGDQSPGWLEGITERQWRTIDATVNVAQEAGATPGQVALAWVLDQDGVSSAIIGPHTQEQLQENLGALDVTLSTEARARLHGAQPG